MEVILREHVDNLGRRGEVVKVAPGYARNFLLPRKLALAVNEGNRKIIEREKTRADARELEEKSQAEAVAARLAGIELTLARRVGDTQQLYGSVTSGDLADELKAQGLEIDKRRIQLEDAIKAVGDYTVPVRLHREVTAQLVVHVVKQGA